MVAVRGSKGKQDHLIDIDFQYDTLLPTSEGEGMGGEEMPEWQVVVDILKSRQTFYKYI